MNRDGISNTNTQDARLILGIETSILSGSIALFDGKTAFLSNDKVVSRSESLLAAISNLLLDSEKHARELSEIVVALGPGSFTGIRIGIATALGISSALGIKCTGLSTLHAFLPRATRQNGYAVIPLGRDQFGVRYFDIVGVEVADVQPTEILSSQEVTNKMDSDRNIEFYLPFECVGDASVDQFSSRSNVSFCREPSAVGLCRLAASGYGTPDLTPHYLRREN